MAFAIDVSWIFHVDSDYDIWLQFPEKQPGVLRLNTLPADATWDRLTSRSARE